MISDKLYSNHTVLIPSKKGSGRAQWSNGQYTGLRVERPGFKAWPGQCVVFLGMTLYSHSASLFFFFEELEPRNQL